MSTLAYGEYALQGIGAADARALSWGFDVKREGRGVVAYASGFDRFGEYGRGATQKAARLNAALSLAYSCVKARGEDAAGVARMDSRVNYWRALSHGVHTGALVDQVWEAAFFAAALDAFAALYREWKADPQFGAIDGLLWLGETARFVDAFAALYRECKARPVQAPVRTVPVDAGISDADLRAMAAQAHGFERLAAIAALLAASHPLAVNRDMTAGLRHVAHLLADETTWRGRVLPLTGDGARALDDERTARKAWFAFREGRVPQLPASADHIPDYEKGADGYRLRVASYRAAHDALHFAGGFAFSLTGEREVARAAALLAFDARQFSVAAFIVAETYGQAAHNVARGRFPASQGAFARAALWRISQVTSGTDCTFDRFFSDACEAIAALVADPGRDF
jgi:hypothetical protein